MLSIEIYPIGNWKYFESESITDFMIPPKHKIIIRKTETQNHVHCPPSVGIGIIKALRSALPKSSLLTARFPFFVVFPFSLRLHIIFNFRLGLLSSRSLHFSLLNLIPSLCVCCPLFVVFPFPLRLHIIFNFTRIGHLRRGSESPHQGFWRGSSLANFALRPKCRKKAKAEGGLTPSLKVDVWLITHKWR
uniref:Uncharacterized protein n=1 Tax=Cucumis sativus TaxID=3659 RepID=A0A0A0KRC0_CUCSA